METPFQVIKSSFNRTTPKIKQIFCHHNWDIEREDAGDVRCYFYKCKKCGKFKDITYYRDRR